ncbi:hypothetical protein ACFQX6_02975 [Streptosporangium lutulentum]
MTAAIPAPLTPHIAIKTGNDPTGRRTRGQDVPPRVRLRPRSIRGRITVLVAFLAALLLIPTAVIGSLEVRKTLSDAVWLDSQKAATLTAAAVRVGKLTDPIAPSIPGIDLIQVVAPGHRVIASSASIRGLPAMTSEWPTPQDPDQDVQTCAQPVVGCVRLTAIRVRTSEDSPVVYAGRPAPTTISTGGSDTSSRPRPPR